MGPCCRRVPYTPITVSFPGSYNTFAVGINDNSQIVGAYDDVNGGNHGFLLSGDTFISIDVPGSNYTAPAGINNQGQIVGTYQVPLHVYGFLATPSVADTTPPVITIAASPATLWPPNGQPVAVTVSGTITDEPGGSGVSSAVYRVIDEYGQIQPSGSVNLGADGRYAFIVALQASRRGNDQNGRHYTITVSANDNAGNVGAASTSVTVPHDQGK
jgi:hypothetical protein